MALGRSWGQVLVGLVLMVLGVAIVAATFWLVRAFGPLNASPGLAWTEALAKLIGAIAGLITAIAGLLKVIHGMRDSKPAAE